MNTDKLLKLCKAYQEASAWAQKARAAKASRRPGGYVEDMSVYTRAMVDAAKAASALLTFLEQG